MNNDLLTVTKSYRDLPAAHRQPNHAGHCKLIHGHNWGFDISFICDTLDNNGFVVDVGRLDEVRAFLKDKFDHTLLLNEADPMLEAFCDFCEEDDRFEFLAKIVAVPNCGMEGLARFVAEQVQHIIDGWRDAERGLRVFEVVCWEDSKNRSSYIP